MKNTESAPSPEGSSGAADQSLLRPDTQLLPTCHCARKSEHIASHTSSPHRSFLLFSLLWASDLAVLK